MRTGRRFSTNWRRLGFDCDRRRSRSHERCPPPSTLRRTFTRDVGRRPRYMVETRETTPIPATILRDTREQRPWTFENCPVETRDVTLSTGDYAVPIHCSHDPETDTYHPQFAIVESPDTTFSRHSPGSESDSNASYDGQSSGDSPSPSSSRHRGRPFSVITGVWRGGTFIRIRSRVRSRRGPTTTTWHSILPRLADEPNCVRSSSSFVTVWSDGSTIAGVPTEVHRT